MLYCLRCGKQLTSADVNFCNKCGHPITSAKKYGTYLAIFITIFIFAMFGLVHFSDSSTAVSLSEQTQDIAKKKIDEARTAINAVKNYQVAYDSALSQYDNILARLQNGNINSKEAYLEMDTLATSFYGNLTTPTNVLINMDRYNEDGSYLADSASALKSAFEHTSEYIRTNDPAELRTRNDEINYAKNAALSTAIDIGRKAKEDGYVSTNGN